MRISDWSSDVCSSDLAQIDHQNGGDRRQRDAQCAGEQHPGIQHQVTPDADVELIVTDRRHAETHRQRFDQCQMPIHRDEQQCGERSEEHTSELQSLMRISYAVFCLTKKKMYTTHKITSTSSVTTH